MRLLQLIPAALILIFSGPSIGQSWFEYVDQNEFFSVNFPAEPIVQDTAYLSATGWSVPARVYSVDLGSERHSITVVNYAGADEADVQSAISHAAETFRRSGGDVTYDEDARVDGIDGHMLQITNVDRSRTFVAINLHLDRLYILESRTPEGAAPPGQFQQSLIILDDQGRWLRYGTDEQGNRIRVIPGSGGQPFVE